ncbi:hypothetical protein [Reyranella soli]|nr:hypothetical protein [Reyranella soli]
MTAIAIVTSAYIVASAAIRPAMYSDSGWGFAAWDTRSRTSAFNHAAGLDSSDIAREAEGFMTMWSPGQHVLPGLIEEAGVSLGAALVAVSAVFSILGLAGWFSLYRSFGFPLRTAMVALAIIACSRFFNLPFSTYNGGEVLQFGVAPWFLLLVWALRDLRWFAVPPLIAGAAVLVFMKLTGIVIAGAAVGFAMVSHDRPWRHWRDTARKLLVGGVTVGLMGVLFYVAWYRRGATAATIVGVPHPHGLLFYVALTLSSTWSAALSLGDLANYIFLNPARPILRSVETIFYVFLPFSLATFGFIYLSLRKDHGEYLRFAFLFAATMVVFLTLNLSAGMSITLDERHLRIASLLLLVGGVHAVLECRSRILQGVFAAIAALSMVYGLSSFVQRMQHNLQDPLGARGVRVANATPQLLDFIRKIDVSGPDARRTLIFMPSPELILEVKNARSWSNHADFESIDDLRKQIRRGRVDRLYVIVQRKLLDNGKADAILRSFVDYPIDGWTRIPLGDFVCFYQVSS